MFPIGFFPPGFFAASYWPEGGGGGGGGGGTVFDFLGAYLDSAPVDRVF